VNAGATRSNIVWFALAAIRSGSLALLSLNRWRGGQSARTDRREGGGLYGMADVFPVGKTPPSIRSAPQERGLLHSLGTFVTIAGMQLELFPYDSLTPGERSAVQSEIRRHYWFIRNLRDGRFGQARLRKHYRMVAAQKKRLLMAGVSKREILDLLACCRLQCTRHKQPFNPCTYCHFS
jgi:hypothetical protein